MPDKPVSLSKIFESWEGYHQIIYHAIEPLTQEQLEYRPAPALCSVGELGSHIALGWVGWFARLQAPTSHKLSQQAAQMGGEPAIAAHK